MLTTNNPFDSKKNPATIFALVRKMKRFGFLLPIFVFGKPTGPEPPADHYDFSSSSSDPFASVNQFSNIKGVR